MNYQQLTKEYQDDHLANAMLGREMEYFHYDFDRKNFENLLRTLPDGACKNDVDKRLADTVKAMENVAAFYEALKLQIRSEEAHAAAVARVQAKRKLEESKK